MSRAEISLSIRRTQGRGVRARTRPRMCQDFGFTTSNTYNIKGIKTRSMSTGRQGGGGNNPVISARRYLIFSSNCVKTLPGNFVRVVYHVVQRPVITFTRFIRRLCARVCARVCFADGGKSHRILPCSRVRAINFARKHRVRLRH